MSKYGKRILAAGMCATMAMGLLTGCSSSDDEVVAKMGDTELTLGEANFMLRYSQAQTQSYLGAMFGEGTNVFQQDLTGSGQAYGTTVKESVLNDLKEMTILEQHMSDYNVELTDEDKAAIEAAAKQFIADNSKDVLKEMSATEETVSRVLTLYTIQSKMETAIEADVDTEVSDDEAAQKTIQYVYFTIPETESESEETTEAESSSETETVAETEESAEKKETRETAQGIIDAVLGGETLEDAVKAVDENKNITDYSYGADEETLNENLKSVADSLSDGEIAPEPVESENGFYVVQMVSTFDRDATDQKKEEIVKDRKKDLYDSVLADWEPESFDINEKVWDKVTFEDIFSMKQEETESENGTEAEISTEAGSEAVSEEAASETEETTESQSESESAAEETESESQSETEE